MNIPKYWVRARAEVPRPNGDRLDISAWGWSSNDRKEAEQKAHERLASLANRVKQGEELPTGYGYGNRPLREEIVQEIQLNGNMVGLITRNSYGSLILNTADVMFIDVDLPQNAAPSQGLLGKLFGKEKPADPAVNRANQIKESLRSAASGGSFRIYRTAGGLRILVTDPVFEPGTSEAENLMNKVSADPSFVQLCRAQRSFRARLTPKPWRCGSALPPAPYPREEKGAVDAFEEWRTEYDGLCNSKATCKFLDEAGFGRVHESARLVLDLHDRMTKAHESLPLA